MTDWLIIKSDLKSDHNIAGMAGGETIWCCGEGHLKFDSKPIYLVILNRICYTHSSLYCYLTYINKILFDNFQNSLPAIIIIVKYIIVIEIKELGKKIPFWHTLLAKRVDLLARGPGKRCNWKLIRQKFSIVIC